MNLERVLGFSPKLDSKPGASLQRARIDEQSLRRAVEHWRSLGPADLPSLRSVSRSDGDGQGSRLNLVLDLGGKDACLCLEIALDGSLPDLSSVWPYCRWWQEELSTFSGVKFEGPEKTSGVAWRLA